MKKYDAGFIGAGNMGGALALAAAKKVGGGKVAVSCSSPARYAELPSPHLSRSALALLAADTRW